MHDDDRPLTEEEHRNVRAFYAEAAVVAAFLLLILALKCFGISTDK